MTAHIQLSCGKKLGLLCCDDDQAFHGVETVTAARALLAAMYPATAAAKVASVVIDCEIGGCGCRIAFKADSVTEGRALAARHNYGWYTARRAGGRVVDGCQWHLGTCCLAHTVDWCPTLDPDAILPGEAAGIGDVQLDMFDQPITANR